MLLPLRHRQVRQRDRIEVVVGQRDEPEAVTPELDDLGDDAVDAALPRLLAVGAPDRAERTVLGTPAHRLHGSPHVPALRQQVPARRHEALGIDTSALVGPLQRAVRRVIENDRPDHVAVAADDGVRAAELVGLLRIQRGVDAAEHDGRARARSPAFPIS